MSHDLVGGRFVTVDEDFDEGDFLLNPEPEPTYSPEESLFRCWKCDFKCPLKGDFYTHFKSQHGSQYSIHTKDSTTIENSQGHHASQVHQTTLTPTKYRQEYVQLSFGKVKQPVQVVPKPQQHHAKSSPTADEGAADASGSSLACLADLAVHKTIDLDTTNNFESRGQPQKANSDNSPEGRLEQNDQSNASEAIEDPQEVTLVQESTADGTAIVAEEKDPVVAADETVSSEKTPNKEVSLSDGVPAITGDTDVNNSVETSVVEEEGVCPECYGMGIADMDQHMRSVHNKVPVIQADTDTEVGMSVEEDTYVVIEEEVSDLTEGFQNRSLQLVDSIHGGVKQFRLESPGPFNSHPMQREPKNEEEEEEMVLYTDGAKVYTVSSTDHQLVPTDQGIVITVVDENQTKEGASSKTTAGLKSSQAGNFSAGGGGGQTYTCAQCGFQTFTLDRVQEHFRFCHPNEGRSQTPPQPLRKSARKSELTAFQAEREKQRQFTSYKTPDGKKMFSCSLCDFETKFGGTIHDHINAIHRKVKHKCTECDFETMYLKTLTYHRTKKHGVKAINCPVRTCKFKTIVEDKLRDHLATKHRGEVNFTDFVGKMEPAWILS